MQFIRYVRLLTLNGAVLIKFCFREDFIVKFQRVLHILI